MNSPGPRHTLSCSLYLSEAVHLSVLIAARDGYYEASTRMLLDSIRLYGGAVKFSRDQPMPPKPIGTVCLLMATQPAIEQLAIG